MKKKVVRALLVACGVLMLAGCGKKGADGSEQGGNGKSGKQTESTEIAGEKKEETKRSTDSSYFYEQLNAEEKAFFDQIREQAESFYQGNEEPKKKEYGDGGVTYSFGSFDQGNLSDERANQIAEMFYFSCPKYFFSSWIVDRNDGKCSLFLWEDFSTRKAINDYRDKLEARTQEWLKSIEGITDDLEKEKAILKLICDNTEVGTMPRLDANGNPVVDQNGAQVDNWNNQFVIGVLVDGKAICNGYAKSLQYLCNAAGLESLYIQAPDAANHAWSMVKLYDDWYCVDPMWVDYEGIRPTNMNLNKSYETFRSHGGGETHFVNSKYADYGLKLPECTKDTVPGEPELFTGDVSNFTIENGVVKSYNGSDVNIVIPASAMEIDAVVFQVDHEVESFAVDENNVCFCAVDGVLFSKDKETLVCYPKAKKGDYTVPAGTKYIADRAFLYNRGVTNLQLPEGLKSIGAGALLFCESMTKINLPDSLESIGFQSMGGAKFLDGRIVLPKSLTDLQAYAMHGSGMTEVVVGEGITALSNCVFLDCQDLETVYLPASLTSMGESVFENCYSLEDIYFAGTKEQWNAIDKSKAKIPEDCEIHFN